jgi:hypothetical protein
MAKGKLFEYAVLYHPKATKDEVERGVSPKSVLVSPPKTVLAATDKEVGIVAAKTLDESYMDKLEDVEIVIRPF